MKMRLRPLRGMMFKVNGEEITVLDRKINSVECVLPNGRTAAVDINDIPLPVIDTKDYEKI